MQEEVKKMLEKQKAEIDAKFELLFDKFDHCIISARDSVPPSLSSVIMELKNEIRDIKEQQKPLTDAFMMYHGAVKSLYLMAKVFGAAGVIITSVYAIKRWIIK